MNLIRSGCNIRCSDNVRSAIAIDIADGNFNTATIGGSIRIDAGTQDTAEWGSIDATENPDRQRCGSACLSTGGSDDIRHAIAVDVAGRYSYGSCERAIRRDRE